MLAEHADIVMGQSPKAADVNDVGEGLPLLNGPTEFGTTHPWPVQFTTKATKHCQEGDLLFCVRGSTTGRMNWADQPYAIGRGIAAIRHKDGLRMQPFLRAVIEYQLADLLVQATGSTFPNVSAAMLARMYWPSLSKECQLNASDLLSLLDHKIRSLVEMNSALEETAKTLFRAWFVDFLPVRAKANGASAFPGMTQELFLALPREFEPTKAGEIPRGWTAGSVRDAVSLLREGVKPFDNPDQLYQHFSLPAFDRDQEPDVELGSAIKSAKFAVPGGSILFSKLNPRIPRIWLPRPAEQGIPQIASTEFLVCLPKDGWSRSYAFCLLSGDELIEDLARQATGTSNSHQRIRSIQFEQQAIPVPPTELRVAFELLVAPLVERSVRNREEKVVLGTLRDTLLPKLISGELEVPSLDAFGRVEMA